MRTRAGDFTLRCGTSIDDQTSVTITHNDPGTATVDWIGTEYTATSGSPAGFYWPQDHDGLATVRFSNFTAYATELEIDGMIGLEVGQLPPQLTRYEHSGSYFTYDGLTMSGTSLPSGLVDLHIENIRSPADVDRIITALEVNGASSGNLFLAEQRLGKTTELLESRGWDVEIEPDIVHHVGKSVAPHTSVIDGKAMHHVDRRRGGDRRKQFEGRCIELNGTSEYATCSDESTPDLGTFTFAAWIRVAGVPAYSKGIAARWQGSGNQRAWLIELEPNGLINALLSTNGVNVVRMKVTSGPLTDSEWHHIAVIFNESTGLPDIYIDGSQAATTTIGSALTGTRHPSTADLEIGRYNSFDQTCFPGQIDDIRIYGTAITDSQIADLAAEGPQLPLATGLPTPLIDLPMDDASSSPIIRNHGSLGQSGDFTLTGTPSSIWTTCDRVSLPNEHGCSVGLVTNGVDSYVDTGVTLNGATAFTVLKEVRYLSTNAYDLDGFYTTSADAIRIGRDTGNNQVYATPGVAGGELTPGTPIPNGQTTTLSLQAAVGGNYNLRVNGTSVASGGSTMSAFTNTKNYLIGASDSTTVKHYSHTEYTRYLIASRVLTDDEITWWRTRGASGTSFDSATDANIHVDYRFDQPHPRRVHNYADPGNPGKIVGDCEWVAINHDAANPTLDMNGKALTWTGPVPRDSVVSSPAVELNGTSEDVTLPVTLAGAANWEFSCLFKTSDANGLFFDNRDGDNDGYAILMEAGAIRVSSDATDVATTNTFDDGEQHKLRVVWDGADVFIYIDDVLDTTDTMGAAAGITRTDSTVGSSYAGGGYFAATIADVDVKVDGVTQGTWPCCESSGDICWDISGNGNHGTGAPTARTGSQNASDVLITNGWGKVTQLDGSSYLSGDATIGNAIGSTTQFSCFIRWYNTTDSNKGLFQMSSSFPSTASRVFSLHHQASGTQITVRFNNANFNVGVGGWSANAWNTIGVVYDGTNVYLWKNGVKSTLGAYSSSVNFTGAKPQVGTYYNDTLMMTGTVERTVLEGAAWSDAEMEAMIAAATISDVAATRPDAYCILGDEEVLQGAGTLTAGGTPNVGPIPAGAGAPVAFGPGVPAPGQSRLVAAEPNSPFALRYAGSSELTQGEAAGDAGDRQLFVNSDDTGALYESQLSVEMAAIIAARKYS